MTRGAYEIPSERCPWCKTTCSAEWCDVGVGMVQCGPFHCENCDASEIGPYDKSRPLTEMEREVGWYGPGAEYGSSANVIGGKLVTTKEMQTAYRKRFLDSSDWADEATVKQWWEEIRKEETDEFIS